MARAGLGPGWDCLFANDHDAGKAAAYRENWGADALRCADIASLGVSDLPGRADLAWASFPCQDLSLAGEGRGLGEDAGAATRSGAVWPFLRLLRALAAEGRAPAAVVLENVAGVLTSRGGRDFQALADALAQAGYAPGALVIDAQAFTPQSRARVFLLAVHPRAAAAAAALRRATPPPRWTTAALLQAQARLEGAARRGWTWWDLPEPPPRGQDLADLVEDAPQGVRLDGAEATAALLAAMSEANRAKVEAALDAGARQVGCLYRRTRRAADGSPLVRTEVRFDGLAGCLRTPSGGSSRQRLLIVEDGWVRSRLLSAREAARLMGLPDSYRLPSRYNAAYHIAGDGVVVPVVAHLARWLLEPLARRAPDPLRHRAA